MTLRQLALNIPRWHSQEADENEIGVDQRRFQKQEHDEAQNGEAEVKSIFDPPSFNPFLFRFHISRGRSWTPGRPIHDRGQNTSDILEKTSVPSGSGEIQTGGRERGCARIRSRSP